MVIQRHIRLHGKLYGLVDDYQNHRQKHKPLPRRKLHRLFLRKLLLGLDGQSGVRHQTKSLLRDELARDAADSVSLVLYAGKRSLQILDELVLPLGQLAGLFLGKLISSVVLHSLERRGGVLGVVA